MQRFSAPPPARLGSRASGRDPYADLLHDTRGMPAEEQQAREAFLARLAPCRRGELFELEVLLKGAACFANPRNHPGPRLVRPSFASDFRAPLAVMTGGLERACQLARGCLGASDRPAVVRRDLEIAVPEVSTARPAPAAPSAERALLALRQSLTGLAQIAQGLLRLDRVGFRLFYCMAGAVRREVSHQTFFNPLTALEFRPEFDRIASPEVLEVIGRAPGAQAQRLTALSLLSLLRMERYLELLESVVVQPAAQAEFEAARIFLTLAVLRADARALSHHLQRRGGEQLSEAFERELLQTPARELAIRRDALRTSAQRYVRLRRAFECVAANLGLELRRLFERLLPSPAAIGPDRTARDAARIAVDTLRPALDGNLLLIGSVLGGRLEQEQRFAEPRWQRPRAEHTRQHVWMFAQIVRAFALKARGAHRSLDRWAARPELGFAREFLSYYRALGWGLMHIGGYEGAAGFEEALAALRRPERLEPASIERLVAACDALHAFLIGMLDRIGARAELTTVAFDKAAAARVLRTYLGD